MYRGNYNKKLTYICISLLRHYLYTEGRLYYSPIDQPIINIYTCMKLTKSILAAVTALAMAGCSDGGKDNSVNVTGESAGNPVIETIMARRSVRQYKDQPVEREKLQQIVECGINAPNGMNRQPWIVRVVDNPEFIGGITQVYVASDSTRAADPAFKNMFRNAPAVIFIASPKDGSGQVDCGLMGENMILAAQSLGLGTCCLGGPIRFMTTDPGAEPYLEKLDIPADYALLYAIGVGYPDESPEAKRRDASKVKFID